MNRPIKDATVKAFHYDDLHSLKADVLAFVTAYNSPALEGPQMAHALSGHLRASTKVPAIFKSIPPPHSGPTRRRPQQP